MTGTIFLLVQFLGTASLLPFQCVGQNASDDTNFLESAHKYHFSSVKEKEMDFELRQKPVMIWSDSAMYAQNGAVFVWMNEGRPNGAV